jgi:urea transport system substrate-binding protein
MTMVKDDTESPKDDEPGPSGHLSNTFGETMDTGGGKTLDLPSPSRPRPQNWVGRRLGKYEITKLLGAGGMGVVLKGHDASIERDVAIKVLPSELSANPKVLDRFLAEARSAGKLNHPNTVTIFEIAQDGDDHFLVMSSPVGALRITSIMQVRTRSGKRLESPSSLAAASLQHIKQVWFIAM